MLPSLWPSHLPLNKDYCSTNHTQAKKHLQSKWGLVDSGIKQGGQMSPQDTPTGSLSSPCMVYVIKLNLVWFMIFSNLKAQFSYKYTIRCIKDFFFFKVRELGKH